MPKDTAPAFETALTIPEVAATLKIHHTLVRRLIQRGELRAKQVGSAWRITPAALREYIGEPTP
jgi:excisionase family DNA binding protein